MSNIRSKEETVYCTVCYEFVENCTCEPVVIAAKDASLGVGHIWTAVQCPAYSTLNPSDCTCQEA